MEKSSVMSFSSFKNQVEKTTHHHALELEAGLADAELELLDDVGDLFEPVDVRVSDLGGVRYHQEGFPLEQHYLVRPAGVERTRDETCRDDDIDRG